VLEAIETTEAARTQEANEWFTKGFVSEVVVKNTTTAMQRWGPPALIKAKEDLARLVKELVKPVSTLG